jgi:hypothetical protein
MMTREEVLAEMEASFATMPEDIKTEVLFTEAGKDWTPTLLLEEVRNDTEMGQKYVKSWSANKEARAALLDIFDLLLGGDAGAMTCGQPDCPNCKGEGRPFNSAERGTLGLGPDKSQN